jgi:hypothetical protein
MVRLRHFPLPSTDWCNDMRLMLLLLLLLLLLLWSRHHLRQ